MKNVNPNTEICDDSAHCFDEVLPEKYSFRYSTLAEISNLSDCILLKPELKPDFVTCENAPILIYFDLTHDPDEIIGMVIIFNIETKKIIDIIYTPEPYLDPLKDTFTSYIRNSDFWT